MTEDHLTELLLTYRSRRDPETIATLFEETAPRLLGLAMHLAGDSADAEDVLQATFLAAIESVDRYDARRPVMGWLTGILTKKANYHRRTETRRADPTRLAERTVPEPPDLAESQEARGALDRAVASLPRMYRQVVELVVGQGIGPAEIATRLQRSPGTVRTQLHRAIAMLRQALPAGLALPAALIAFESTGLAAVKQAVVQHATEHAAVPATAAHIGAKLAVLVPALALLGTGAWALLRDPDAARHEARAEAAAGFHAPDDDLDAPPADVTDQASRRQAVDVDSARERAGQDAGTPSDDVRHFGFELPEDTGYSLARRSIVPLEQSDFAIESSMAVRQSGEGLPGLAQLAIPSREIDGRPCSQDCYLRAVASFRPDDVVWDRKADLWKRSPKVFLVRVRGGGWAVVALVNRVFDPVEQRFEWQARCAYNPREPVFRRAARTQAHGAIDVDPTAFETDPFQRDLDARCAAELAELDRAVEGVRSWPTRDEIARVRGVLSRRYGTTITCSGWDYHAATYDFEHDTRDDVEATRNDWSFVYSNGGDADINVCTVTDDCSQVWNLGSLAFDQVPATALLAPTSTDKMAVAEGDLCLVHTLDSETDRWDLVKMLQVRAGRWLVFQWTPFDDPQSIKALLAAARSPAEEIQFGEVLVQMRAGAGGGNPNQAFLDGTKNGYVGEIRSERLSLVEPIDSHEKSRIYVRGGKIPLGKVWEVHSIYYECRTNGDANGAGGFRVVLGGKELVEIEQSDAPHSGVWTGKLALRRGEEAKSFVEIRNSSQCEVRILGTFRE